MISRGVQLNHPNCTMSWCTAVVQGHNIIGSSGLATERPRYEPRTDGSNPMKPGRAEVRDGSKRVSLLNGTQTALDSFLEAHEVSQ